LFLEYTNITKNSVLVSVKCLCKIKKSMLS